MRVIASLAIASAVLLACSPSLAQEMLLQSDTPPQTPAAGSDYLPAGGSLMPPAPMAESAVSPPAESCGGTASCGDTCSENSQFVYYARSLAKCLCGANMCSEMFENLSMYSGPNAFRQTIDLTRMESTGNFGFTDGVNWGIPLTRQVGFQAGFNALQDNLSAGDVGHRDQEFVTLGLFHRPCDGFGWQGGVVCDLMVDQEFNTGLDATLAQIRGNISVVNRGPCGGVNEWGAWFAKGVSQATTGDAIGDTLTLKPYDLYVGYYKRHFACGGEGSMFGGFAPGFGGVCGIDIATPIGRTLSIHDYIEYWGPSPAVDPTARQESWTVGFAIVWHPCYHAHDTFCSPYRPLFDVADDGTFLERPVRVVP